MTNAKGLQLAHGRLSREDGARREPEVAREALGRREDAAARADERQITRGLTERRHRKSESSLSHINGVFIGSSVE